MCTSPRHITIKNSYNDVHYLNLPETLCNVVPCGQCAECRKARQNSFTARAYRALQSHPYAYFITLTYRNESLPIAITTEVYQDIYDEDTGEFYYNSLVSSSPLGFIDGHPEEDELRSKVLSRRASRSPRVVRSDVVSDLGAFLELVPGLKMQYVLTPSLRRFDVREWLKTSRIQYERDYGCKLSDFVYLLVGEYGPNTCRPHYHMLLMSDVDMRFEIDWMCERWNKKYGFTLVEKVKYVNEDGTDGAYLVSRYLGKYMCKGKDECKSVRDGVSEKPRICASMKLGDDEFFDKLHSYYYCFDLFGKYDLNTFRFTDGPQKGKMMDDQKKLILIDNVISRLKFKMWNHEIHLPRYFRDKLFSYVNKKTGKHCRYALSFAVGDRLRGLQEERMLASLSERIGLFDSQQDSDSVFMETCEALRDFWINNESALAYREQRSEKDYKTFLQKSKF